MRKSDLMNFEPIYKKTSTSSSGLIYGNPESDVAIVTLWSKAKDVATKINPEKYCVLGQLFSAERGLDLLLRNLLANPKIRKLVVTGIDFSKSGIVLLDFFNSGFEKGVADVTEKPCWRVKSKYPGYIGLDIPEEDLKKLRESMTALRTTDVANFNFSSIPEPKAHRESKIYLKPEEASKQYIGEYIGYTVRGKTIAEAWLKLLDVIMKFGKISGTHYEDQQKEVVNLLSIISDEDPNNFHIPQRVKEYVPRITRDVKGIDNYTYGSRMRSWFGIDQINNAITKLVKQPISRAVVINLWDSVKDLTIGGSPCLNHIWFRITDNKLHMTCVFRSHDMFEGYPENLFGLRALQEEIRQEIVKGLQAKGEPLDIKLGNLCILSQSAHIYEDSWEHCQKVTEKYLKQYTGHLAELDPRGNFVISIEGDEIVVEHTSTTNETLGIYRAKSSFEMMRMLTEENIISLIPHALDIGRQLMKAEMAIKLGTHYNQDQGISIDEIRNSQVVKGRDKLTIGEK
jgi:thymidylate synthase